MAEIRIPLQEQWREKVLAGEKDCTSRTKRFGKEGDTFEAFGVTFVLTTIERRTLFSVGQNLYKREGCDSPGHYARVWLSLHPRTGWVPDQKVWTHFWEPMKEAND